MYANKVKLGQKTLENLVFKKKRSSNFSPKHNTVEAPNTSSMSKFATFAGDMTHEDARIGTTESVDRKLTGTCSNSRQEPIVREN